ncbi:MAG TPA: hypothetical protein VKE71_14825 [Candidatus Angelobacter sp.]|nr:hypothetical protein [Candidatus Angelobacter sp.]
MSTVDDNRVLSRRGARLLTSEETKRASGSGLPTDTPCTFDPRSGAVDGDVRLGEC